jgi:hypothetical protein
MKADYCDVCKASQMVAPDGEHLCGLDVMDAYSFGLARGIGQSNYFLEIKLREQMHAELAKERERILEACRVASVLKKGDLFYQQMEILKVHNHDPRGVVVVVR